MGHEWIIDVLTDLKSFAKTNDLPLLAAQLDEAALVASGEIGSMTVKSSLVTRGDGAGTRSFSGGIGPSRRV